MSRAGEGRDCIPCDCLAVTATTGSGGLQPVPSGGTHCQHRQPTPFLPREGRTHPEEPGSRQRARVQTDIRQMGGGAQSGARMEDEGWGMGKTAPQRAAEPYSCGHSSSGIRKCFSIYYSFFPFSC